MGQTFGTVHRLVTLLLAVVAAFAPAEGRAEELIPGSQLWQQFMYKAHAGLPARPLPSLIREAPPRPRVIAASQPQPQPASRQWRKPASPTTDCSASAVETSWQLNQALDSGTNPPAAQATLNQIQPWTSAVKLLGAGGGGFLV